MSACERAPVRATGSNTHAVVPGPPLDHIPLATARLRARCNVIRTRGGRGARINARRPALLDPVPLPLAPERCHIDSETRGCFLERRRLGEHALDVPALEILEGDVARRLRRLRWCEQ